MDNLKNDFTCFLFLYRLIDLITIFTGAKYLIFAEAMAGASFYQLIDLNFGYIFFFKFSNVNERAQKYSERLVYYFPLKLHLQQH